MALATIVILETSALVVQMEVITRIRSWLFNHALPVWTEKCMDSRFGGPVESFSLDGDRPFTDAYKRTFVVARQLYVMSHASLLGEKKAGPLADALFEYLRKVPLTKVDDPNANGQHSEGWPVRRDNFQW